MITAHCYPAGKSLKHRIITQLGAFRGHTMEHFRKILQTSTKHFADSLMTETNAEDGFLTCIGTDDIKQQPCL